MRMNENSRMIRVRVIEHVGLIAGPSGQMKYKQDVPIADVLGELICGFTDDLYAPKSSVFLDAFTERELKALAEFHGMLCIASKAFRQAKATTVEDILKLPEWRSVIAFAKDLLVDLGRNG